MAVSISVVRQPGREAREPVVERALGVALVQQRVHHRIRHRGHLRHDRRAELEERCQLGIGPLRIGVADQHRRQLHPRSVRRMHQAGERRHLVRAVLDGVAVEPQQVARGVDGMGDDAAHHHRLVVQAVAQRCRHAEVAAAAAKRPHQVGMCLVGDVQHLTCRRHQLHPDQVVGRKALGRHQPAQPAAQRVAADPGAGDGAARDGQPVLGRSVVQIRPDRAALRARRPGLGVDGDPAHLRQVDHQAALADGAPGHVVPASPHRDLQPVGGREPHGRGHVDRPQALGDHGRPPVDQPVVDAPRALIVVIGALQHPPCESVRERPQHGRVDRWCRRHRCDLPWCVCHDPRAARRRRLCQEPARLADRRVDIRSIAR